MRHVLFLDFDGVLHPQHQSGDCPFAYMGNFCNVLRECDPDGKVLIVVSSTWRLLQTLDQLRTHFPRDIALRIVGVTPRLRTPKLQGSRQREIEAWMLEHAPGAAWLAVDDIAFYFEHDCQQLFLVDEDFPEGQTATAGDFSLVAEIEERERLTALWQSRGLGINVRVANSLQERLKEWLHALP